MTLSRTTRTPGRVLDAKLSTTSNVKVVVRIRPENTAEHNGAFRIVVKAMNEHVLAFDPCEEHLHTPGYKRPATRDLRKRARKDLKFAFDYVFGPHTSNQTVFEHTTKTILDGFLNGYNCSVFAYGATGAGKTHTMLGSADKPGVMYLTMVDLYDRIDAIKEEKSCEVAVSYLEVYNEQIRDLLLPKGTLPIREDANNGVIVSGLSLHKPKSAEELLCMLQFGNENRSQHPTDANAESSRSHAVFQVYVRQKDRTANISAEVKIAKLCLVDLAGSERATVTTNRGARFREGANINRSLLALGNVINALADNKSKGHIPYRDSKLTRLLKDSLGGNCRTVMIAAVSPSSMSYDDTYNTLKYADRAKNIRATLKKNILSVDFHVSRYGQIVEDLRKEILELKSKLTDYEEGKTISVKSSKQILNQEVIRLQDVLHNLFSTRLAVRKEILNQESTKRDIIWKIYKKEKIKKRLDLIDTDNSKAGDDLLQTVTKNQNRLVGIDKSLVVCNNKYIENTSWLDRVQTEMKLAGGDTQSMPEMLEVSLRMHQLEVELGDSRHHCKHLKKLFKNQERQGEANDRLIMNLLKMVKKQHMLLKGYNLLTSDLNQEYNEIKDELNCPEISWADQTVDQSTVEMGDMYNISNIFNLPVLNILSLKGATPSRVRNKRRLSCHSPQPVETNTQTKIAASVLKNSPLLAQRVRVVGDGKPLEASRIEQSNQLAVKTAPIQNLNPVLASQPTNLSKQTSLLKNILTANTFNNQNSVSQSHTQVMDKNKINQVVKLHKKSAVPFIGAPQTINNAECLTPYAAREERPIKSKPSYDIPDFNLTPDVIQNKRNKQSKPGENKQSKPGENKQSKISENVLQNEVTTTVSHDYAKENITPYKAREERAIKGGSTYKILEENLSLNSTYVKCDQSSNQNTNNVINQTVILSSPLVLKERNINSTTVSKPAPFHKIHNETVTKAAPSHTIHNETITKVAPDVIKVPEHNRKHVARSIVFESTPPSSRGMSYADVVKTPSPVRTPLEQINCNVACMNSNVTPDQFKINLDTPKFSLSNKCKENLKKLRETMEKTMSNPKNKRNRPNYMSMTRASSIKSRLQFKDSDEPMTARRIPVTNKVSLAGRMSKSKSTSSLNRGGWQF